MKVGIKRPSPAMVVALIALIVALSGSAYAAFRFRVPPNSVGPRQLKAKAVTTGKIANGAVTGPKILEGSITGADIDMAQLGTVPKAAEAAQAANASTLGTGSERHSASCPANTTLIRGICFDSVPNAPVNTVTEAADHCAANGGWLPSPLELYSIRGVLNLGTGVGSDHQFTDSYFSNTSGGAYRTIVVNGNGAISESEVDVASRYICAYLLVR